MAHYEEGDHNVTFIGHGFDSSPDKGTPYIFLKFKPEHGQYERQVRLWLTEKTVTRTVERLRKLGWTGDSFSALQFADPSPFAGVKTTLFCGRNGQYEEWDFPYEPKEAAAGSSNDKFGKKLDALFGHELKGGNPPPDKPKNAAQTPPDDDIPF